MNCERIRLLMEEKHPQVVSSEWDTYWREVERLGSPCKVDGWELHHIAPRAMFPELKKDRDNWVWLTLANHFLIHKILTLAVPSCLSYKWRWPPLSREQRSKYAYEREAKRLQTPGGREKLQEWGRKGALMQSFEHRSAAGLKGGPIGGRLAVESGRLASYRTPEHQRKASKASTHSRWHIKRGVVNISCKLCLEKVA